MNYGIRSKVFSQWRNLSEQLVSTNRSIQKSDDGILYVLRTEDVNGKCFQKNTDLVLPGHHRRFQQWNSLDIFKKGWIRILKIYDDYIGINWTWQSIIDSISIKSPLGGAMTARSNPTDRSKLGTKRHILTDKNGIPISVVISSSASTHDIKLVTSMVDNAVIKRTQAYKTKTTGRRRKLQYLCLDKAYNCQPQEQELIKRGYVSHIPPKRKRNETEEEKEIKVTTQHCSNRKKHSAKRWWIVERANSWHNRFRKLLARYEKKSENYLGLIQLSCCMIIHRKIILG
jgi:putative transposase